MAANVTGIRTLDGECQDEGGTPIRDGVVQLDTSGQTVTDERFASCLAKSQAFGGMGCCVAWAMMQAVGSGRTSARCSSFSASVWITGFTYVNSSDDCPENTGLGFAECEEATGTVPSVARRRAFSRRRPLPFPAGRSLWGAEVAFDYAEAEAVGRSKRVCRSHLTVDDEGTVTTNGVSYDVPWGAEGPPARGSYTMSVHSAPVFDAQPASSDVHNRLSITSVALVSHCSVCDVDEAFSDGESNTVFEVDGRFDRNLESRVKLAGVKPVFMKYAVDGTHERRKSFLEVEALLDHLFRHNNTPVMW